MRMISYQLNKEDARKKVKGPRINYLLIRQYCMTVGNLGMAWIYYKKAYDVVPHSCILESHELVQMSDNILEFVKR